jgi:hypothetical protein
MTKIEMLQEMENHNWDTELDKNSSYREVKEEFQNMIDEYDSAEDTMFPNGRDYDSEDW